MVFNPDADKHNATWIRQLEAERQKRKEAKKEPKQDEDKEET